jgi:hypothetical protein
MHRRRAIVSRARSSALHRQSQQSRRCATWRAKRAADTRLRRLRLRGGAEQRATDVLPVESPHSIRVNEAALGLRLLHLAAPAARGAAPPSAGAESAQLLRRHRKQQQGAGATRRAAHKTALGKRRTRKEQVQPRGYTRCASASAATRGPHSSSAGGAARRGRSKPAQQRRGLSARSAAASRSRRRARHVGRRQPAWSAQELSVCADTCIFCWSRRRTVHSLELCDSGPRRYSAALEHSFHARCRQLLKATASASAEPARLAAC